MSIGAKDYIDQMLVKKYAKERVNNAAEAEMMAISADKYWKMAKEMAQVHQAMIKVSTLINKKRDNSNQEFLNKGKTATSQV